MLQYFDQRNDVKCANRFGACDVERLICDLWIEGTRQANRAFGVVNAEQARAGIPMSNLPEKPAIAAAHINQAGQVQTLHYFQHDFDTCEVPVAPTPVGPPEKRPALHARKVVIGEGVDRKSTR